MLINCTPHDVTARDCNGNLQTFPKSGKVARVKEIFAPDGCIGDFDVRQGGCWGEVEGLPDPVYGTTYIVSAFVCQALKGYRYDLVCPDTGMDVIRDDKGQIASVARFVRY